MIGEISLEELRPTSLAASRERPAVILRVRIVPVRNPAAAVIRLPAVVPLAPGRSCDRVRRYRICHHATMLDDGLLLCRLGLMTIDLALGQASAVFAQVEVAVVASCAGAADGPTAHVASYCPTAPEGCMSRLQVMPSRALDCDENHDHRGLLGIFGRRGTGTA
ncbi:hypothetical protein ACHAWF_008389 [Thalassiosira exigua]